MMCYVPTVAQPGGLVMVRIKVRAVSRDAWEWHISRPGRPGLESDAYPTKYTALRAALSLLSQDACWPDVGRLEVTFDDWEAE